MSEPPSPPTPRAEPSRLYRWAVLVFISLAMFGNYYVYDAISPLADVLKQQLGFSDSNIGLLNAIYSIPNVFMVLVGGFLIDRIGTKKATLLFGILCLLGAAITAATGKLAVMAAGRLVFGIGAESLIVSVTTALAKWFRGKELSFAFGINLTIARLGSFAALNSPSWASRYYSNWQWPLFISVAVGVFCVAGAVIYWILESRAEQAYELGQAATDKVILGNILRFGTSHLYIVVFCAISYWLALPFYDSWHRPLLDSVGVGALCVAGIVIYRTLEIHKFGKSYWYIVALCITFYSAIFPFQTFAVKFFIEAHGTSRETGGFFSSMLTLFAIFATPLFGLLVDRVGKRALFMTFGSLLLIPVYLIMAYTRIPQFLIQIDVPVFRPFTWTWSIYSIPLYVPMALMGIAFSLIPAVMWPSVAYIVDQAKLGTAYGLMTMIQNIGLAGFNLLVGWANDFSGASAANPGGYALGMWIFSVLGFLGVLFSWLLRRRETGPEAHGLETITATSKS